MRETQKIKLESQDESWTRTRCYINGKEINHIRSVDFSVAAGEIPTFIFEVMGLPDIDMFGDIRFDFTPSTVHESIRVLQNELSKHGNLYNGFCASILSVIEENNAIDVEELSRKILDRIIGKE